MNLCIGNKHISKGSKTFLTTMHWLVLLASGALMAWIVRDTLQGVEFLASPDYRRFQLWVCLLFQIDIITEWVLAPKKWRYLARHLFFILISIVE